MKKELPRVEFKLEDIKVIEPNYEGIAKVLFELEKLYKVVGNQYMLDRCLEGLFNTHKIIDLDTEDLS